MAYGFADQRFREVCSDSPGNVVVPEIVQAGLKRELRGGPDPTPRVLNGEAGFMVSHREDAREGLSGERLFSKSREQGRGGGVERDRSRAGFRRAKPETHPGKVHLAPSQASNLPAARSRQGEKPNRRDGVARRRTAVLFGVEGGTQAGQLIVRELQAAGTSRFRVTSAMGLGAVELR